MLWSYSHPLHHLTFLSLQLLQLLGVLGLTVCCQMNAHLHITVFFTLGKALPLNLNCRNTEPLQVCACLQAKSALCCDTGVTIKEECLFCCHDVRIIVLIFIAPSRKLWVAHKLKIIRVVTPGSCEAFSKHLCVLVAELGLKMLNHLSASPSAGPELRRPLLSWAAVDCGRCGGPGRPPECTEVPVPNGDT